MARGVGTKRKEKGRGTQYDVAATSIGAVGGRSLTGGNPATKALRGGKTTKKGKGSRQGKARQGGGKRLVKKKKER